MQYDMQKLGRMTLEQLTEIAKSYGLKVRRGASLQSIIYDILDAQADKRGAEVQAKEEAKQAKAEEKKLADEEKKQIAQREKEEHGHEFMGRKSTLGEAENHEKQNKIQTSRHPHRCNDSVHPDRLRKGRKRQND